MERKGGLDSGQIATVCPDFIEGFEPSTNEVITTPLK